MDFHAVEAGFLRMDRAAVSMLVQWLNTEEVSCYAIITFWELRRKVDAERYKEANP